MGFTFDAKHVLLCGLVTLLFTYAAFHDKFPSVDAVSVQGRKGLTDSELTPVLGDDVVEPEDVTFEAEEAITEGVAEDAAPTEENVESTQEEEFSQEDSEELHEEKAVREMEETSPDDGGGAGTQDTNPDPTYNSNPFLLQIQQNNAEAAKKEDVIQSCMAKDGCGTSQ